MLRGLYFLTDPDRGPPERMLACTEQALQGGAALVQYRDKHADPAQALARADALLALCRRYRRPLIINDDIELAARIGAEGVHLGRDDADPRAARARLGPQAIIGVSCYADLQCALEAQAAGASYVAFGSFFRSTSKPQAPLAPLSVLHAARAQLTLPLCAIGGIHAGNAESLIEAGADLLAVIHAVASSADPRAAAQTLSNLFPRTAA